MPGYTKLFNTIVSSTIWAADAETCKLWVTMLALADRDGLVEASIPGLAHQARISVDKAREGLKQLSAPDPDSRTPDHEGRRIKKVNGGWQILNYDLYRHKYDPDEIREKAAERKRNQRLRDVTRCHTASHSVTPNHKSHDIAEAEAYTTPPSPPSKGGVVFENQNRKSEGVKRRICLMPGCSNLAREGNSFCSDICEDYAAQLEGKINARR